MAPPWTDSGKPPPLDELLSMNRDAMPPRPSDIPNAPRVVDGIPLVYERPWATIAILDNYPTELRFTDGELALLSEFLDGIGPRFPELLSGFEWIAARPSSASWAGGETCRGGVVIYVGDGATKEASKLVFDADSHVQGNAFECPAWEAKAEARAAAVFNNVLGGFGHEFGHVIHLIANRLGAAGDEELAELYLSALNDSRENSRFWNFVSAFWILEPSYYIERTTEGGVDGTVTSSTAVRTLTQPEGDLPFGEPYGRLNVREFFASIVGNWFYDTQALLDAAADRAAAGYPALLDQFLFVAPVFYRDFAVQFCRVRQTAEGRPQFSMAPLYRTAGRVLVGRVELILTQDRVTSIRMRDSRGLPVRVDLPHATPLPQFFMREIPVTPLENVPAALLD